jgi:hypothetical protein
LALGGDAFSNLGHPYAEDVDDHFQEVDSEDEGDEEDEVEDVVDYSPLSVLEGNESPHQETLDELLALKLKLKRTPVPVPVVPLLTPRSMKKVCIENVHFSQSPIAQSIDEIFEGPHVEVEAAVEVELCGESGSCSPLFDALSESNTRCNKKQQLIDMTSMKNYAPFGGRNSPRSRSSNHVNFLQDVDTEIDDVILSTSKSYPFNMKDNVKNNTVGPLSVSVSASSSSSPPRPASNPANCSPPRNCKVPRIPPSSPLRSGVAASHASGNRDRSFSEIGTSCSRLPSDNILFDCRSHQYSASGDHSHFVLGLDDESEVVSEVVAELAQAPSDAQSLAQEQEEEKVRAAFTFNSPDSQSAVEDIKRMIFASCSSMPLATRMLQCNTSSTSSGSGSGTTTASGSSSDPNSPTYSPHSSTPRPLMTHPDDSYLTSPRTVTGNLSFRQSPLNEKFNPITRHNTLPNQPSSMSMNMNPTNPPLYSPRHSVPVSTSSSAAAANAAANAYNVALSAALCNANLTTSASTSASGSASASAYNNSMLAPASAPPSCLNSPVSSRRRFSGSGASRALQLSQSVEELDSILNFNFNVKQLQSPTASSSYRNILGCSNGAVDVDNFSHANGGNSGSNSNGNNSNCSSNSSSACSSRRGSNVSISSFHGRAPSMSTRISNSSLANLMKDINVLVADDSVMSMKLAVNTLKRSGYEAVGVSNGALAVEKCIELGDDCDVIIMDLNSK